MSNLIKKVLAVIILIITDLVIMVILVYFSAKLHFLTKNNEIIKNIISIIKEKGLIEFRYRILFCIVTFIIAPPFMTFHVWLIKRLCKWFKIYDWQ